MARPTREEARRRRQEALDAELEDAKRGAALRMLGDATVPPAVTAQILQTSRDIVPRTPTPQPEAPTVPEGRPTREAIVEALRLQCGLVPGTEHLTIGEYIAGGWTHPDAQPFVSARGRTSRLEREQRRGDEILVHIVATLARLELV